MNQTNNQINNHPSTTTESTNTQRSPYSILWASAFVLFGLILIQVQTIAQPFNRSAAEAGMVATTGPLVLLIADAGTEDLLLSLDGRSEELMVYRTDRNGTLLHERLTIPKLFEDARTTAQGR